MVIQLNEVFGISINVPEYTYVDRDGLDKDFLYHLSTGRHLVIYGSSKQGKTVLRKKNLPADHTIVVQCRAEQTNEELYVDILRLLHARIPTEFTTSFKVDGSLEGQVGLPLVTQGKVTVGGEYMREQTSTLVGADTDSLGYLAEQVQRCGKKVVIEDFHYLPEEQKRRFAFDLKALYERGVTFILVGIWSQQNLLAYYLGDLIGRVEELDVTWKDFELARVLRQGERALNIDFGEEIRGAMISDASGNVGLLQRFAERYCRQKRILESQENQITRVLLHDLDALQQSRNALCNEQQARYGNFFDIFRQELDENKVDIYEQILRTCLEASETELINGLADKELLERIKKHRPNISEQMLENALENINLLQAKRQVYPTVFYYNSTIRRIQLVDRELLFYRKYHTAPYRWEEL